ncbi:MAG: MBL fold metallo-hydrolase [Clostridia bacterium]|nr:MBL fold metallo-hydrolase [Clostridia bacterium]
MKKIKWMALLLAFVLFLSACTVVTVPPSSNGGDTQKGDGDETNGGNGDQMPPADKDGYQGEVDLSQFKMVYARSVSDLLFAKIPTYQDDVKGKTGADLLASKDRDKMGSYLDTKDYEILFGRTSRKQSEEAYNKLNGKAGFVVAQIDNKVVITGTSDYMVDQAWNHFYTKFVLKTEQGSGKIAFDKDYCFIQTADLMQTVLGTGSTGPYSIVYDADLDTTEGSEYGGSGASHVSYLYKQAQNFRTKWANISGKNEESIGLVNDRIEEGTTGIELVFGRTDRAISADLLGALSVNEYGVLCHKGQIAIGGWSDEMVVNATNHLTLVLDYCKDYVNGSVSMPIGVVFSANRTAYPDGVPQFEGGTLVGVVESGSGTLDPDVENATFQECYADCTPAQYESYCSKLLSEGFTLYQENRNKNTDTNQDNTYRTYVNGQNMVHVYLLGEADTVRVIVSRLDQINMPNVTKENYTKITEPKLTQMRFAYSTGNFGLCTILTLEDGSFIIYDGGGEGKNNVEANDDDRLYSLLTQLNPRKDGKIVIAAWILTHQHWDHYYNFYRFCEEYGKNVTIEQYICNLSSSSYKYNSHNPDGYGIKNLIKVRDQFMLTPFDIVEVHTGQKMWVRNVQVEIMFTQEDMYPSPIYYFNNTTLVTRLHVTRTTAKIDDAVSANTTVSSTNTVLMLGDQNFEASHYMLDMYGKTAKANATLKSDIVQVAHHGVNGVVQDVYEVADPTLLLWPTSNANYNSWTTGGNGGATVCHYENCAGDDEIRGNSDDGKHYYKKINKTLRAKIDAGTLEVIVADVANWTFEFPWAPGTNIYFVDDLGVSGNGTYKPR